MTIGKIRKVEIKPANRDRLPTAVGAMTCRAGGLIQLLTVKRGPIDGLRMKRDIQDENRKQDGDKPHRAATVACGFRKSET